MDDRPQETGRFDIAAIAASFPATAATLLLDRYLTDTPHASASDHDVAATLDAIRMLVESEV